MLTSKSMSTLVFLCAILTATGAFSESQPVANASDDNSSPPNTAADPGKSNAASEITTTSTEPAPAITRSQFTTAIVDREPTDDVVMLTNNSEQIYFFSELANLKGQKVTHRWEFQGKTMAEVKFDVKSDRWRVYSSKTIKPDWTGEWSVVLVDESGNTLDSARLDIVEASSTTR